MGNVPAYPFSMELRREASVHQKPTPLPPHQRAWVNKEMAQLERAGVVRRAPTAKFTSKVVLVEEG